VGRLQGLEQGLAGSEVAVKTVLNGDWTPESASRAVTSWLRLKARGTVDIHLVAAQNDSMAAGARQAIEQLRPEWAALPFTGCDGLPSGGQKMVAQGRLAATIVKPTTTGPAIELATRRLKGEKVTPDLILHARSHPPLERLRV
jgi:ribose transport system substrate-binding protein